MVTNLRTLKQQVQKDLVKSEDLSFPESPSVRCSFSGRTAEYYVGLTENPLDSTVRIVGAVCGEFVETAINNLLGQGTGQIQWPLILGLDEKLLFHSYEAHGKGLSPILGWKEYVSGTL